MVFFIPPPQNNLFLFASASPPSLHSETKDKTMQLNGGRDRTEGRSVSRLQDSDPVWRLMDLDRVLRPGRRCSSVTVQPCAAATPASFEVPPLLVSAARLPLKG